MLLWRCSHNIISPIIIYNKLTEEKPKFLISLVMSVLLCNTLKLSRKNLKIIYVEFYKKRKDLISKDNIMKGRKGEKRNYVILV